MSSITRDIFLKKVEVEIVQVPAPELGGTVYVKGMTAKERSVFETQFQLSKGGRNLRTLQEVRERLVVACLCDEKGSLLLTKEDISSVGNQPAPLIERIVEAAQGVCGMTDEDVDGLAGNSEETPPVS